MLPSKNKLKVKFQVVPSDRQLWAIGLVVTSWTHVEKWLQLVAYALTAEDSPERIEFDQNRAFKRRLDLVEVMIETQLRSPYRENFRGIIFETRDCQDQRDKIVHNSWGDDGPGTATFLFNWMKPAPVFNWKLDFGGLKTVATRIDAVAYAWQMAVLADESGEDMILLSEALNRKRRNPA